MKKFTLSHLIGKSQHYVNIISKSRLFVDFFAMSSICTRHEKVTFDVAVFIAPLLSNTVDSTEKPDNSNVQVQVSKSNHIWL